MDIPPLKGGIFRRRRDSGPAVERGPWLGSAALLTVLSVAAGVGLGAHLVRAAQESDRSIGPQKAAATAGDPAKSRLRRLKPIVTNLGEPTDVWARLEAAIVFEDEMPNSDVLAARIGEDLLGYLKTLKLGQLEGASQFQQLREDLKDRVAIRSGGEVRDFIIESLVVQ